MRPWFSDKYTQSVVKTSAGNGGSLSRAPFGDGGNLMADTSLPKWTGMAGVAMFALTLAVIPLYFVYSGPPPAGNVLTRALVGMLQLVAFLGFVVGLQALVRRARPAEEALATLLGSLGVKRVPLGTYY